MFKYISITLLFTLAAISSFAQPDESSAPVNWQRYAVTEKEVSVLFPKMPTALYGSDVCSEKEVRSFHAYADQIVYSLAITAKAKQKPPSYCAKKRKFSADYYAERIAEARKSPGFINEEKFTRDDREVLALNFSHSKLFFFNDLSNNRWFELSVHHRKNRDVGVKEFVESISVGKNPVGIEIGNGSPRTLGDGSATEANSAQSKDSPKIDLEENLPLNIIVKPKPLYTDAARQNNIQGTVTVRVVFLANGGIGSITPVSALSHGLTEQAIAAARKLVFLPQKAQGQPQTVVKSVQYSFSIY
jgi:TonB family protein